LFVLLQVEMPVSAPRRFASRINEITEVATIEEKLNSVKLGPKIGDAMKKWCNENSLEVGQPFRRMKHHDIQQMATALRLKALEKDLIEAAFLGDEGRSELPRMNPYPRSPNLNNLPKGNLNISVKTNDGKEVKVEMASEDTVAVAKARIQLAVATLQTAPFEITFAGEILDDDLMTLGNCRVEQSSVLTLEIYKNALPPKLGEIMHRADLGLFLTGASSWCENMGAHTVDQIKVHFEHIGAFLQLNPMESFAFRSQLGLPRKKIDEMSLEDVAAELAIDGAQFRKNCSMLGKMTRGAPNDVAKYLYANGVTLTAQQCKKLFEIVFSKVSARQGSRYPVRSQLVMALHCFCVEPYAIWEDDGDNQCMWTHMTYGDLNMWESGLCTDLDGKTVGEDKSWGRTKEDSCKGGCGFYPGPHGYCSLCSVGKGPKYPGGRIPESAEEARRILREDVSGMREALKVIRPNQNRQLALQKLVKPKFYGELGDQL
jgi:hypothetical protein